MKILHICANPKPTEESVSKQLAAAFFGKLAEKCPDFEVTNEDLYSKAPPFLSYEAFRGFWFPIFIDGYTATDEEIAAAAYAHEQGELFREADVLVLTTPMWNYGLPAILKAWIDQVLSPGVAFNWGSEGAEPSHQIKKVVMLVASGGVYKEDDPRDALTSQVRAALQFVGIDDIEIAWADGQNPIFFSDCELRKQFAIEAAEEIAEDIASVVGTEIPASEPIEAEPEEAEAAEETEEEPAAENEEVPVEE